MANKQTAKNKSFGARVGVGIVLFLVVMVGTVGWMEWQGWPFLKDPLSRLLSKKLERPIQLSGDFSLHLWKGLRLRVGQLEMAQPSWIDAQSLPQAGPMLMGQDLNLRVPFSSLLTLVRQRSAAGLHIDAIELTRLDAVLVRESNGRANWDLSSADIHPPPSASSPEVPMALPHVDHLVVKQGALTVKDAPLQLKLAAILSTSEGDKNHGSSGLEASGKGTYLNHAFQVHVSAAGVMPLMTQSMAVPPMAITVTADAGGSHMSFKGETRDLVNLGSLNGQVTLSGPSLSAVGDLVHVTTPTTAAFDLKGRLMKTGERWTLQMDALHVGESDLKGQFTFEKVRGRPFLQGELTGSHMALVDLAPAFGAPTAAAVNPPPPPGLVLPHREFDVPSLQAMDAQIKVRIKKVSLGSWFAQPLEPLDADLSLRSGVLTITNLLANTAGGSLAGSLRLESNQSRLQWRTELAWDKIKLENWLKTPTKPGPPQPTRTRAAYVSGELAGRAKLTGSGNSTASLLASLNGSGTTWIRNGQVSHLMVEAISLHVAEALGLLITGDQQLPMLCAAARMQANNGLLTPEVAIVDTPSATILVSGGVSLAKEQLGLKLVSHPKALSPLSLRTPIDVTGTFANPQVNLHPNPLGIKILGAVVLGAVAPLAGILPLIDVGRPQEGGCGQALQALQSAHQAR